MYTGIDIVKLKKWLRNDKNRERFISLAEKILAGTAQIPREYSGYTKILRAIHWEGRGGFPVPISHWRGSQRRDLIEKFIYIVFGYPTFIRLPDFVPLNTYAQYLVDGNAFPTTVLSPADAWRVFVTHVASSLYIEISGLLQWSMRVYTPDELRLLLDSRSYFRWRDEYNGYWLDDEQTGHLTPTDACCLVRFASGIGPNGLIGPSTTDTIANALEWCRHNLVHFAGGFTAGNVENTWHYRGYPPITTMIVSPHYTAGCWGTTAFIQAVLRIVNLPVKAHMLGWTTGAHDTCHFVRQGKYLSHADDCANLLVYSTPPFPARELMIDQDTYDSWFQYPNIPADVCQNNIGRQTLELALKYLPDYLLKDFCDDQNNGRPTQSGKVMETFKRCYSHEELMSFGLWTKLQLKVNSFGGCQGIPHSYDGSALPWVP